MSSKKRGMNLRMGVLFFHPEDLATSLPVTADKILIDLSGVSAAAVSSNKEGGPF
jgi:hypothetical protein